MKRFLAAAMITILTVQGMGPAYVKAETAETALLEETDGSLFYELSEHFYDAVDSWDEFMLTKLVEPWDEEAVDYLKSFRIEGGRLIQNVQSLRMESGYYALVTYYTAGDDGDGSSDISNIFVVEDEAGDYRVLTHPDAGKTEEFQKTLLELAYRGPEVSDSTNSLQENDPEILVFLQKYYSAVEEKNEAVLSQIVYPWSDVTRETLWNEISPVRHQNLNVWSKEVGDQEYGVIVEYDKGSNNVEMKGVFLFRDTDGSLKIVSTEDTEHDAADKMALMRNDEEVQAMLAERKPSPAPDPSSTPSSESSPASAPAPAQTVSQGEYIFPDIDKRYLSEEEVRALTLQGMNYAKNEVYARHGRIFESPELQQYFGSKSWYKGTISANAFSDNVFNAYEKSNVKLISRIEKETTGTSRGYKLDQSGYDINAVLTKSR